MNRCLSSVPGFRGVFRLLTLCFLLMPGAACLMPAAFAQQAASEASESWPGIPARIAWDITGSSRMTLRGSLHPLAQSRYDAGRVDSRMRLSGMSIAFARSAAQQADLTALIAAQQNPSSPQYRKWLTPDQFAQRFGMAQADLDKVSQWLEQQGFTVDRVARSRDRMYFSGTATQVEQAFSTEMHYYNVDGQKHFAPNSALSIPPVLAGIVLNIGNLDSFRPHPMHQPLRNTSAAPRPEFSSGTSGNTYTGPGDIATIYDVNSVYKSGFTGTGQSVAIMGESFVDVTDIEHFQTASGWSQPRDPQMVLVPGSGGDGIPVSGDEAESDLDLEWSSTMAPGAQVFFVYTGSDENYSVFDSMIYAVEDRIAPVISISYGACELAIGSEDGVASIESAAQQGAAQGQTLLASSGDDGASSCFGITGMSLSDQAALTVSYPASSSWFTAVGGTEFNEGTGTYWNKETGTDIISSAISYIPEVVWNEDSEYGLGSSGGGVSTFFTKPDWQTGVPGIPADGQRDVPDVALDAAGSHDGLLLCSSDTYAWASGQLGSCTNGFRDVDGTLTVAGGTSFAAPMFAGMIAVLNQQQNATGLGNINPNLYALASNAATYASAFHDITGGDNKCNVADASICPNGATGYAGAVGYDLATGIGSPDFANLAEAWGSSTLTPTSVSITPSVTAPQNGATVSFTVSVAAGSGGSMPGGSVSVLVDGTAVSPALTLASGTASFSQAISGEGNHIVVATYSGDGTFAGSSTTLSLSVPVSTTTTVVSSSTQVQIGKPVTFSAYVYDNGGSANITGSVSIQVDGATVASSLPLPGGSAPVTYTTSFSTEGKHTVQATYSGAQEYGTSTGVATVSVLPVQVNTTVSIAAAQTPVVGVSDTFTVNVIPASGTGVPTGSVTVYVAGTSLGALTLVNGAASFNYTFQSGGTYLIQGSYSGSTDYLASTGTLKAAVSATPPAASTTTVTAASAKPGVGASDAFTIAVAPASGAGTPTGSVSISVDGAAAGSPLALVNGTATYTTSFTQTGQHTVSAAYNGDGSYAASTGSATVTVAPGSFTLAASSISIQKGSSGTSTITVTPQNGYTGTVSLAVSTPAGLTGVCVSAIPNATVNSTAAVTETLTVSTGQSACPAGAAVAGIARPVKGTRGAAGTTAAALAGLLAVGLLGRRSRRLRMLCLLLALTSAGFALAGCGGSTRSSAPTTATLTITGTDTTTTTITAQTTLTLTVD